MSAKISKLLMAMALLSPFGNIATMAQGHFDASKKAQTQGDTLTTPIVDSLYYEIGRASCRERV